MERKDRKNPKYMLKAILSKQVTKRFIGGYALGYLDAKGLEDYSEDILGNLIPNLRYYEPEDLISCLEESQLMLMRISRDYIDKWKYYNNLWGES